MARRAEHPGELHQLATRHTGKGAIVDASYRRIIGGRRGDGMSRPSIVGNQPSDASSRLRRQGVYIVDTCRRLPRRIRTAAAAGRPPARRRGLRGVHRPRARRPRRPHRVARRAVHVARPARGQGAGALEGRRAARRSATACRAASTPSRRPASPRCAPSRDVLQRMWRGLDGVLKEPTS